MRLIVAFSFC